MRVCKMRVGKISLNRYAVCTTEDRRYHDNSSTSHQSIKLDPLENSERVSRCYQYSQFTACLICSPKTAPVLVLHTEAKVLLLSQNWSAYSCPRCLFTVSFRFQQHSEVNVHTLRHNVKVCRNYTNVALDYINDYNYTTLRYCHNVTLQWWRSCEVVHTL